MRAPLHLLVSMASLAAASLGFSQAPGGHELFPPREWLVLAPHPDAAPRTDPMFTEFVLRGDEGRSTRAGEAALSARPDWRWEARELEPVKLGRKASGPIDSALVEWTSPRDDVFFVNVQGARCLFVNGVPYAADPARRGGRGVPVAFREGANEVVIRHAPEGFEVTAWRSSTRLVIDSWSADLGVLGENDPWSLLEVPITVWNVSSRDVRSLHFHFNDFYAPGDPPTDPRSEWKDGGSVAALGAVSRFAWPKAWDDEAGVVERSVRAGEALFPVAVWEAREDVVVAHVKMPVGPKGRLPIRPGLEAKDLVPGEPIDRILDCAPRDRIVYGTRRDADANRAHARFIQQRRILEGRIAPEIVADVDVESLQGVRILIGNADSLSGWEDWTNERMRRTPPSDPGGDGPDAWWSTRTGLATDRSSDPVGLLLLTYRGDRARLAWRLSIAGGDERGAVHGARLRGLETD